MSQGHDHPDYQNHPSKEKPEKHKTTRNLFRKHAGKHSGKTLRENGSYVFIEIVPPFSICSASVISYAHCNLYTEQFGSRDDVYSRRQTQKNGIEITNKPLSCLT
eukprot:1192860-Prorocentrum_minimum.AAC.5